MQRKATCPNDPKHDRFTTTAHVMQEWVVNSEGGFLEVMVECLEVTHEPHPDNLWTCAICGADATVD